MLYHLTLIALWRFFLWAHFADEVIETTQG